MAVSDDDNSCEDIFVKHRALLVDKIDLQKTSLGEKLVDAGLLTANLLEYILENDHKIGQNRELITTLERRCMGKEGIQQFIKALYDAGQGHILNRDTKYLQTHQKILRVSLANLYLSWFKRIVLWGTGVNPVSERFDAIYTDMTWMKVKRGAEVIERGQLDHYTDMLKDTSHQNILIWGEAGVGKTIFCEKFCQDWALAVTRNTDSRTEPEQLRENSSRLTEDQINVLSKIDLLFYIVLRDTNENQTLEQVLEKYFKNIDVGSIQGNILILCDGLDEISYKSGELLEVMHGRRPGIKCIVTCRPHASLGLSLSVDAEIRQRGFTLEQAQHFVFVYFLCKCENNIATARSKSNQCWQVIKKSPDLLEMSTNPSMLQLMCLVYSQTGKVGQDRATLLRDYTNYLLHQYHRRHKHQDLSPKQLMTLYKDELVQIGHLGLKGLKQSHLQLVFTKDEVLESVGQTPFYFGFISELPSTDRTATKVQFTHKSLQEYLAALAVVNSPEHLGLQLLMQFCSSSQSLMGSQIILTFITAMSERMGKVIQQKIEDFVKSWGETDHISPKDRVDFLVAMLKENKSLEFSLPREIHINLREHDTEGIFAGFLRYISYLLGRKSAVERFFSLDSDRVRSVNVGLGKNHRLELLQMSGLEELSIDFQRSCKQNDLNTIKSVIRTNEHIQHLRITNAVEPLSPVLFEDELYKSNLKSLKSLKLQVPDSKISKSASSFVSELSDQVHLDLSGNRYTDKAACVSLIKNARCLSSLNLHNCGIIIDMEIAQTVAMLSSHAKLDLSGNTFSDNTACIYLINNAHHLSSLNLRKCGINIDLELARAVYKIPEQLHLDLSGNRLFFLNETLLEPVLKCIKRAQTVMLAGFDLTIGEALSKTFSLLPAGSALDLSTNRFTRNAACVSLINNARHLSFLSLKNCGIEIDLGTSEAVSYLQDQAKLDLSGNTFTNKGSCIALMYNAQQLSSLNLRNCGMEIDEEVAKAVSQLPEKVQLDLSGNTLVKFPQKLLPRILSCIKPTDCVNLSGFSLIIENTLVTMFSLLPKGTNLNLSGNSFADRSGCISVINNAHRFASLNLENCGIKIDTTVVEAVSQLPTYVRLLLINGNKIVKMKEGSLIKLLSYLGQNIPKTIDFSMIVVTPGVLKAFSYLYADVNIKIADDKIDMRGWGVTGDAKIITGLAKIQGLTSLCINDNTRKNNKFSPEVVGQLSSTVKFLPKLQELLICYCGIRDWGCVSLVSSLSTNCQLLRVLSLSGNHISSSGLRQMLDPLQKMKNLEYLVIKDNPCCKDSSLILQARRLLNRNSSVIDLCHVITEGPVDTDYL